MPVHVVQRGNNRQAVFFDHNDYRVYLGWLGEAALEHGCSIHAYTLMTNHVHLLVTPKDENAVSAVLQAVGRRFVPFINRQYRRTGTLWVGRFKASLVQEEGYLLACYRYIEMNPVRAGIVLEPGDYPWLSYRGNAVGEHNALLSPHSLYLGLGASAKDRQATYRDLFASQLDSQTLRDVRSCVQTGTPLGNDRFMECGNRAFALRLIFGQDGQ